MDQTRKTFINLFILLNFVTMLYTHLPHDSKFFSMVLRPVKDYLSFFSIYQDWQMFAKNPSRLDVFMTAEIEFIDGSKTKYSFPRPTDMNLLEKYISGERYRKIISEAIRRDTHRFLWKDTAKFALRKIKDTHFNKIPRKVHLYRHWKEIPDVEKKFIPHLSKSNNYQKYRFYTYEVL